MSASALKSAVTGTAPTQKNPKNFPAMLDTYLNELKRALPSHLKPERMARIALTAFRRNPKLAECDPRSVFAAVIQASQLGLEIDTLGRAYLLPYKKNEKTKDGWVTTYECQLIPGWKGLVDLVNRAGKASVWTGAVFQGDQFDFALGDRPFVKHQPSDEFDPDLLTHVYAVGRVQGSEWPVIEVWSMTRVKKHLARYNKVGTAHYAYENWEMYARKVVLLQVLKYMPSSAEMAAAIGLNDAAEIGKQGLTVKDAIEGTWAPMPEEPDEKIDEETGEISGNGKSGDPTPEEQAAIQKKLMEESKGG